MYAHIHTFLACGGIYCISCPVDSSASACSLAASISFTIILYVAKIKCIGHNGKEHSKIDDSCTVSQTQTHTHTHIKSLQCDNVILYSGHENELGNACSDVGFERVHLCFHVIPHSGGTVRRGNVKSMRVHGCFHGCMHVKCVLCRFCTVALTPLSLVWVCTVQLAFEAMLIPSVSPAFWQHDPSTTSIVSLIQDY